MTLEKMNHINNERRDGERFRIEKIMTDLKKYKETTFYQFKFPLSSIFT